MGNKLNALNESQQAPFLLITPEDTLGHYRIDRPLALPGQDRKKTVTAQDHPDAALVTFGSRVLQSLQEAVTELGTCIRPRGDPTVPPSPRRIDGGHGPPVCLDRPRPFPI